MPPLDVELVLVVAPLDEVVVPLDVELLEEVDVLTGFDVTSPPPSGVPSPPLLLSSLLLEHAAKTSIVASAANAERPETFILTPFARGALRAVPRTLARASQRFTVPNRRQATIPTPGQGQVDVR